MARSNRVSVELVGSQEVANVMGMLTNGSQNRIYRGPVRKAMSIINKDAKRRVPVLTGALKSAIAVKVTTGKRTYVGGGGATRVVVGMVGVRHMYEKHGKIPNYYAFRIEKGWHHRQKAKGKRNTNYRRTPGLGALDENERRRELARRRRIRRSAAGGSGNAQPFLEPAFNANKSRAYQVIRSEIKGSLMKELKKLQAKGKVTIGVRTI